MFTKEKLLQHLEPVVFTAAVYALGALFSRVCSLDLAHLHPDSLIWRVQQQLQAFLSSMSATVPDHEAVFDLPAAPGSFDYASFGPLSSFHHPASPQHDSPLFALPAEIFDMILTHALTDYEDLANPYPFDTCYRRPQHLAPRRTDTAILRTCQSIYKTYWYLPWTQSLHTFYLTADCRRPHKATSITSMKQTSDLIEKLHPDAPACLKQVANVQIFPQLFMLENGIALSHILCLPNFRPCNVTITIRHTDWWFWESDSPMKISDTSFVRDCRFPVSTNCVNIELESLERRKQSVDWMATKMARQWHFTRADGVHLVADPNPTEACERWKGTATWGSQRWVRDENEEEPNVLSYYIVKVAFRAVHERDDPKGYRRRNSEAIPSSLHVDHEIARKNHIHAGQMAYIQEDELRRANITSDLKASEAVKKVMEWRRRGLSNGCMVIVGSHDDSDPDDDDDDDDYGDDYDEDYVDEEQSDDDDDDDDDDLA